MENKGQGYLGRRSGYSWLRTKLVGLACIFAVNCAAVAALAAPEPRYELDIPSSEIGVALIELARQTKRSLILPSEGVKGERSIALKGTYTLSDALRVMLEGANLSSGLTNSGVIAISLRTAGKSDWEGEVANGKIRKSLLGGVSMILFGSSAAVADENENGADALEKIIVTATKRVSNVQSTPVAITALSADALEKGGISDLRGLDVSVPSMFVAGDDGFGSTSVSIRGIGSLALGNGADEGVGVYVDGVYQGKPYGNVFEFADIDRVEVLRGPQGTLYGRNATGGAINIITKLPGEEFSGRLSAAASSFDGVRVGGYVMSPINDNLSIKISGAYKDNDGYSYNPIRDSDLNAEQNVYSAAALRWRSADTDVVIRGYYGETKSTFAFKNILDGLPLDVIPADGPSFDDKKFYGVNGTIQHDFGQAILTSISGYAHSKSHTATDSDGGADALTVFRADFSGEQFSQEIRLTSPGQQRFRWMAGAFLFLEKSDALVPFDLPFVPVGFVFADELKTRSYSGYLELNYDFTDALTFTAGARYTYEEKDWEGCALVPYTSFEIDYSPNLCDNQFVPDDNSWSAITPHFVLDYRASDDLLIYASATRGFRSGGWNFTDLTLPAIKNGFDPEYVWSYELGGKFESADKRYRLNLAGFYADYSDLLVRVSDPITALLATKNAASANIYGIEVEGVALPVRNLELSATTSWLNAKYKQFRYVQAGELIDYEGNRLNRAPEWNISVAGQYIFEMGDWGSLTPRVEYRYVSEIFHSETNEQPFGSEPFNTLNLRLRLEPKQANWAIQAFFENATNERYRTHTFFPTLPTYLPASISPPRIWGVEVSYKW